MKNSFSKIFIIAGSDPSGGAGIQADIKVASYFKTYCASAITCATSQNTKLVNDVFYFSKDFLEKQIKTVLDDIKFDAIKIGMLGNKQVIDVVYNQLKNLYKTVPIIFDPVMVSTSKHKLLEDNAIEEIKNKFLKISYLTTPNIDEAQLLSDVEISSIVSMKEAAIKIKKLGAKNVLIKGGHLDNSSNYITNVFLDEKNNFHIIKNKKIEKKEFHGTGCSLACAIACNVAKNNDLLKSIKIANSYIYRSVKNSLKVGSGSFVLKHF